MKGNRPNGRLWGADTGCFTRPDLHDDDAYLRWLSVTREGDRGTCLFATAPDVVGDAVATLERSVPMLRRIRDVGYPAALVAQDGLESLPVPWDEIDALFLGGTTAWKLGEGARSLAGEARRLGKHVHMGRVNSERRLRYAKGIGCHSADGTHVAFRPDIHIPRLAAWLGRINNQLDLGL